MGGHFGGDATHYAFSIIGRIRSSEPGTTASPIISPTIPGHFHGFWPVSAVDNPLDGAD